MSNDVVGQNQLKLPQSPLKLKLPESDQVGSPLFAKLPAEIRLNIYSLLLISPHPIESPHRLFRSEPVLLLHNRPPAPSIDAVFLCTCQKIHREALPVLYGNNTLAFSSPDGLEHFAHTQLQRRSSAEASVDPRYLPMLQLTEALFNFNFTAAGRFHLVRDLQVRLALSDYPDRYAQPYRADLVFVWFSMLHDQSRVPRVASFPALETLPLDFSDWGLGQDDALIVSLALGPSMTFLRGVAGQALRGQLPWAGKRSEKAGYQRSQPSADA